MKTRKSLAKILIVGVVGSLMFATLASAAAVEIRYKEGLGNFLTDEKGVISSRIRSARAFAQGPASKMAAFFTVSRQ